MTESQAHSQSKALAQPSVIGVTANYESFDPHAVFDEMVAEYDRLADKQRLSHAQSIGFDYSPVCLVFVADAHLGHPGVNIRRVFSEAKIVVETPGMYLFTAGDMIENMILAKLMNVRFNGEEKPEKEWALLRMYFELVAPKLVGSVSGNHSNWVQTLTGIPYFLETLRQINPQALYDFADVRFVLRIEKALFPVRARHRWRYFSKHNPTHGIEDLCRFDGDFQVGVGAHTHTAGVVRTFNARGKNGMAVLCGSYKDVDEYAVAGGFPKHNTSTAMAVIFYKDGAMIGVDRLEKAAELMRMYHSG